MGWVEERMGRIKRPMKRVTNTGQRGFGFSAGAVPATGERQPIGDPRFKEDDPYHLFMGDRRLDTVLREQDLGWVLELRRVLAALDYSLLTARYSRRGRRAFHPRTVLGLILFGLFKRQQSLRALEDLSKENIGALWVCGGHRLDHSTIGKFIQLHTDGLSTEFFTSLATWVVAQLHLRPGLAAIDGTVVQAAASHWQAIKAEAAQLAAAEAARAAARAPHDEPLQEAAATAAAVAAVAAHRVAQRQRQGKPTESVAVVPSEPEAVIQPRKDGTIRPAYKPTTMVHASGVIVGQHVDPASETVAVGPLLAQHATVFGAAPSTLLLDAAFHTGPLLGALAEQGIDVLCPSGKAMGDDDWEKPGRRGRFGKLQFRYDADTDEYHCPAGQRLRYADRGRDAMGRAYRRYRTGACADCALRAQCTTSRTGRRITRYADEEYKEAMALVLQQPRARAVYSQRMALAEPVYAECRERFGLRRFHRHGLRAVRAEFALYCIAFNIKKVLAHRAVIFIIVLWALPDRYCRSGAPLCGVAFMGVIHCE
jgi:transposase